MSENAISAQQQRKIETVLDNAADWLEDQALLARDLFGRSLQVSYKPDQSPVTEADCLLEENFIHAIRQCYPEDAIFGEESGTEGDQDGPLWVIDPIDGTKSFLSGNPLFGMLLAYLEGGEPLAGAIAMPALSEIYTGGLGVPATRNGRTIHVSGHTSLEASVLYINEGDKLLSEHPELLQKLLGAAKVHRFAYDCYSHALLSAGHIDCVVDYDLKPYDFLAVAAVVKAAGGIATDWQGQALTLKSDGRIVTSATREIHAQILDLLNG